MSEALNFRSSFNGFNREDVVHYIEYLNSNHENQLKQLQADLAAVQKESLLPRDGNQDDAIAGLKEQFTQQEAILTALNAERDELIAKRSQLEAVLTVVTAENKALTEKVAQLEAQVAAATAEEDAAINAKAQATTSYTEAVTAENKALTEKIAQLEAQVAAVTAEREAAINAKPQICTSYMEEELAAYRRAERVERQANERANAIYRKLRAALQDTASKTNCATTNLDSIADQFGAQLNALRTSLADSKIYLDQSLCSLEDIRPKQDDV